MDPYKVNENSESFKKFGRNLDEKFCENCGRIIKIKDYICPNCGVRLQGNISKPALLLITFFLGGIGGHKFYTKKYLLGVLYLCFFWTFIPGLISFIEFLYYAFTSEEKLQEKYSSAGAGVVVAVIAGFFGMIMLLGILAAIAIPNFVTYKQRSVEIQVRQEMKSIAAAEKIYYLDTGRYTDNLDELEFIDNSKEVIVDIIDVGDNCFVLRGRHPDLKKELVMDCNELN